MKYAFHPEALKEYAHGVEFYAEQRVELAQGFINAVENAIFKIVQFPNRYSIIDEDIRRCLIQKFPYAILYTIEENSILILAIMHCSRKPGYWQERIKLDD